MQLMRKRLKSGRKANVTVEFALVATFILMPLLAASADFLSMITAQAQLNTALQALYDFAWTNPSVAVANTGSAAITDEGKIISAINGASLFHITLSPGTASGSFSNLEYACVNSSTSPATVSALQPYATAPASTCPSGQTQEIFVQYTISTNVNLPFPLPLKIKSPFPISSTGAAQV
jgi:Flp pilus assembly protein TadG